MKKGQKRMIIIVIIIGIIIVGGIVFIKNGRDETSQPYEDQTETENQNQNQEKYVEVLEDGTKINTSNKLKETKMIEGLEVRNTQLINTEGVSRIRGTVVNTTGEDKELMSITLTLYDENGEELTSINGLISPVKSGESVQLNMGISADYSNAYDYTIEKN